MMPLGRGLDGPARDMVGRIYKQDLYTLPHTSDFEGFFYAFPMMPLGVACMDSRGMVGRIVVSEKRFFYVCPIESYGS